MIPVVFISYSHDSEEHKNWVLQLATHLRSNGVDVILDRWKLKLGSDLAAFMEKGLSKSNRVICICSDIYVRKANEGKGGVGYEKQIMTAELINRQNINWIIPLIKNNANEKKTPTFLSGRLYINFEEPNLYESKYEELLRDILDKPVIPIPPIGKNPFQTKTGAADPSVSPQLLDRLRSVTLDAKMFENAVEVLSHPSFPKIMSMSGELVFNPIWTETKHDVEQYLDSSFRPDGPTPPRVMPLDIFLIKAEDSLGRPHLLTYFSGKPKSGWQAFLFPFRQRDAFETEPARSALNAKDLASFLGVTIDSVSVFGLARKYVISVKPDPGYGDFVVYLFTFCSVKLASPPEWLALRDAQSSLEFTTRRFHWFHPEELEQDEAVMRVNADLIRAVHYLFATTIPAVPSSVAPGFLKD